MEGETNALGPEGKEFAILDECCTVPVKIRAQFAGLLCQFMFNFKEENSTHSHAL